MKKIFYSLIVCILFFSCTSKTEKLLTQKEIKTHKAATVLLPYVNENKLIYQEQLKKEEKLKSYINEMSLEKRIAQLFIENLEGNSKFQSYERYSSITGGEDDTPLVAGGYLFFSYNLCDNPQSQLKFMQSINDYCKNYDLICPFLAIDQEGGFVNRLKKLTGGLASQEEIASTCTPLQAYSIYADQAVKMSELGFHMNLAPVVEICTDNNREFLNGRSFGNAVKTAEYSKVCVAAYEENNIAAVIKHFPGNTNTDPHTGLPEIKLSAAELEDSLKPFKRVIRKEPEGVLMSHARTSAIDGQTPACLSYEWVTEILRKQYGFDGIIFSDDIFMGALANNGYPPEKAAVLAIEAGVNCIMTSEKRFGSQAKVLYEQACKDKAFEEKINESVFRLLSFKIKHGIFEYEAE